MRLVPLSVVLSLSAEQSPSPADGALGVAEVIQVLPGEERLVVRAGRSHRCAECGYGVTLWRELPRCPMCGRTTREDAPAGT